MTWQFQPIFVSFVVFSVVLCHCCNSGGGVLPYKGLMGMCRGMGSHFHDWIDYNGDAFLIELLEWGRSFSDFRGKTVLRIYS